MIEPMNKFYTLNTDQCVELKGIEPSEWRCELFGAGESMTLTPIKGTEPNWFWRWMQFLLFGNRWYKNKG